MDLGFLSQQGKAYTQDLNIDYFSQLFTDYIDELDFGALKTELPGLN